MSKQVYFVVGVDLDTREPFIDDDVFTARFDKSEQVWDTESCEWSEDSEMQLYSEALEILNTVPLAKD
jgi:hypothetical protein